MKKTIKYIFFINLIVFLLSYIIDLFYPISPILQVLFVIQIVSYFLLLMLFPKEIQEFLKKFDDVQNR